MVHALEITHRLLITGGTLVEVHDQPGSTYLELGYPKEKVTVGPMIDSSNFLPLRQAENAVIEVIGQGLFESIRSQSIDYKIYIDSLDSFKEWMSRQWNTSFIIEENEEIIHSFLSEEGDRKVIVSRLAGINILRSL